MYLYNNNIEDDGPFPACQGDNIRNVTGSVQRPSPTFSRGNLYRVSVLVQIWSDKFPRVLYFTLFLRYGTNSSAFRRPTSTFLLYAV